MADEATMPEAERKGLAFQAESMRAFMFRSALSALEGMREDGVVDNEAAVMTGLVEAGAQLWAQVSHRTGVKPDVARRTFRKVALDYFDKHMRGEQRGASQVNPS